MRTRRAETQPRQRTRQSRAQTSMTWVRDRDPRGACKKLEGTRSPGHARGNHDIWLKESNMLRLSLVAVVAAESPALAICRPLNLLARVRTSWAAV